MKRPKPFAVGKVRVRVHSGPREDGRWRWRADRPAGTRAGTDVREAVWSGWGTRDEAEAAVIALLSDRGEVYRVAEDVRTVRDLLDVWIADVSPHDRSAATTRSRRGCAERLVGTPLAAVHLARLDRRALDTFVRGYSGAPSTCRSDLIALRAAWAWGRERDLVPNQDLPRVVVSVRPEDAVTSRYTPTPLEVAAVLDRLRERTTRPPLWPWRAVLLLYATGCRPGEIATLTWDRVDLERRVLDVTGKTGRRRVPVTQAIADELASWERVGPTVHGAHPASILGHLHNYIRRACAEVEIEWQRGDPKATCTRWSLYGLRRAAVVRLYRAGEDPSVAAAVLGHSPQMALAVYRQVTADELGAAVERAGLGVLPAVEPDNVVPIRGRDR